MRLKRYFFRWRDRTRPTELAYVGLKRCVPKYLTKWLASYRWAVMFEDLKTGEHQSNYTLREHAQWALIKDNEPRRKEALASLAEAERGKSPVAMKERRAAQRKERLLTLDKLLAQWERRRKLAETKLKKYRREQRRLKSYDTQAG